jgi:phosphinothricin acetyltransferase
MTTLREAVRSDATVIAEICNASVEARDSTMQLEPVDPAYVRRRIEGLGDREVLLVLEAEGRVVGWGLVKRYSDRGGYRRTAETSVYVRRNRTGEGVGSQIQAALIERCRSFGDHHLVAKVWADNAASVALHRRFGYEDVGVQREVGRVNGEWKDVLILQKLL